MLGAIALMLSTAGHADIYQLDSSDEIHLSNLVDQTDTQVRYVVLISEPPALPTTSPAVHSGTGTRWHQRRESSTHPYATLVQHAAQQRLVDPALIYAVMATESANNPLAVSRSGARGLMQLMPATARRYQVTNPHDPKQNIDAGARYLQELQSTFKGDIALMLAAYNAGPNAVIRHGYRIPPYAETLNYVPRVLNLYKAQSRFPSVD